MSRSFWRLMLTVIAAMALTGVASSGVSAQDAVAPHPSHIHEGTCDELDPNPAYPLSDVAAVSPDAPAGAVEVGHSTIDVTLDELLASPYALNVHESAENVATYIACGNVAGPVVDGLLLIPLYGQNESGYAGIAALSSFDDGYGGTGTNVSVYIAPGHSGGAATDTAAEAVDVAEDEAGTGADADTAAAQEVAVSIIDFSFEPQVLEIPVGSTVTWTNNDTAQHTATSTDGVWDSGILDQGGSFSFTFDTVGTFDYICSLHPNMTGQIVVTG